jgi:hypothetical protein
MESKLTHTYTQPAKIKTLQEKQVILQLPDGQEFTWPRNLLPESIKEGQAIRVLLHDAETEEEERQKLARALVNEIFHPKDITE